MPTASAIDARAPVSGGGACWTGGVLFLTLNGESRAGKISRISRIQTTSQKIGSSIVDRVALSL
eukprot:6015740-Pyramimonas_sp.AAC.1